MAEMIIKCKFCNAELVSPTMAGHAPAHPHPQDKTRDCPGSRMPGILVKKAPV